MRKQIKAKDLRLVLSRRRKRLAQAHADYSPAPIRAERDGDTLELFIYGVIGEDFWGSGISALEIARMLSENKDAKVVLVRINSPGGDVFDGLAMYNSLVGHGGEIQVRIDGLAASAATMVACAGDKVTMGLGSQYMIHRAWTFAYGNEEELDAVAELLRQIDGEIAGLYSARSGQDTEHFRELMNAETWLTAEQAIEEGLADEIADSEEEDESEEEASGDEDETQNRVLQFEHLSIGAIAMKKSLKKPAASTPAKPAKPAKPAAAAKPAKPAKPVAATEEEEEEEEEEETPTDESETELENEEGEEEEEEDGKTAKDAAAAAPKGSKKAATLAQLKAACPGASSDFLLGQLEKGVTASEAQTALIAAQSKKIQGLNAKLAANAETEGNPLSSTGGEGNDTPEAKRRKQMEMKVGPRLAAYAAGMKISKN